MIPMPTYFLTPLFFCLALSLTATAQTSGPPSPPTNFDSTAETPQNLPAKLDFPSNTHIDMTVAPKVPLPPIPPAQMNNPCLLSNPLLESAAIESNQQDIHATFHWQGGRSSEAFIVHGICFRLSNLALPQNVTMMGSSLDLWLNRVVIYNGAEPAGGGGNIPEVSWYSPSTFVGTASYNGSSVYVFSPIGKKADMKSYPKVSICIDPKSLLPVYIDDNTLVLTFAYTPDPNVQINPQGAYLKAIVAKFGHYP